MAKSLQFRRGNTSQTLANTMASGELFVNTDQGTIFVGDGLTPGGNPLATQNQLTANVATLNASLAANVAGLVTQSQLSANVATLNNSIASVSCGLTQCFNSKISCSGGVTLSGATVCSSVECNLTLAGTLTMNGSTGNTGQVLCSTGTGVGWGSGGGAGAAYFQSSGCNIFFCPITTSSKTTACYNIALGAKSTLGAITTGNRNIGIGTCVLSNSLTCGCNNIAIGHIAGKNLFGGAGKNIAIGYYAQAGTSGGCYSVSIGTCASYNAASYCSISIGKGASMRSTASVRNIAIGLNALQGISAAFSKCDNVAIGTCAMICNCTGNCNIAIGYLTFQCSTTGTDNVMIGSQAGRYLKNVSGQVIIGRCAGKCNAYGQFNVFIGQGVGCNQFTARSVILGLYAGQTNSHYCSVMLGQYAGRSSCSRNSVGIGSKAAYGNFHTFCNEVSIGYGAHKSTSLGVTCNNIAIGTKSLYNNCTGFCNIVIGLYAGCLICSGGNNVILGPYTGSSTLNCTVVINAGTCQRLKIDAGGLCVNGTLVSGGGGSAAYCKSLNNSVFAPASCNSSLSTCLGCRNILMGLCAGYCIVSTGNIAIGAYAGKNLCTTSQNGRNVFIGYKASCSGCSTFGRQVIIGGYAAATNAGYSNVILGFGALSCTGTQTCAVRQSVAIGTYAMASGVPGTCGGVTTGSIAIGFRSGIFCGTNCVGLSCTVGNINIGMYSSFGHTSTTWQNTVIGQCAGWTLNGSQNTILGMGAGGCNNCALNISGTNNTLLGYNAQPLTGACSNTITLGNSSITTIRAQVTSITSLSDYRDKTYIETLPVGLEFLRQVRPVTFTWKMRDGSKVGQKEAGFIAQELEAVTNNSTIKDWLDGIVISNEDRSRLEAAPGKMLPLIVKAIQELAVENDSLKARVTALEAAINK